MAANKTSPALSTHLSTPSNGQDAIIVSRHFHSGDSQTLQISFERTVRVADNATVNELPPGLGHFPLFSAASFKSLPLAMSKKAGFFMPIYQREPTWIRSTTNSPFAIKIYIGGVNAISGEPAHETEATSKHRFNLMPDGKSIQDYIVAS